MHWAMNTPGALANGLGYGFTNEVHDSAWYEQAEATAGVAAEKENKDAPDRR
jgi:hypothetical protein